MASARDDLERYRRDLSALLSALDSGQEPESLNVLEERFSASFEAAAQALAAAGERERSLLAGQLAELRRLTALAHGEARVAHGRVGERIANVARARRALSATEHRATGDSCDVQG